MSKFLVYYYQFAYFCDTIAPGLAQLVERLTVDVIESNQIVSGSIPLAGNSFFFIVYSIKMKKPCTGTLYKVAGKIYCVGEKLSKKVKGTTINRRKKNNNKRTRKHRVLSTLHV